ncbi:hypothetical protein [Lysinibacillus sp. 54212]|uniref:hypothetical protein n=1 Tax=Lysinibacillus sp. 54212 TaxID=3119829 RepID=UPI002FC6F1D7
MKKTILIGLAIGHVFLSFAIFIVGREYENAVEYSNVWVMNFFVSVLLLIAFSVRKNRQIIPNSLLIAYPLGLVVIGFIVFNHLPNFTYKEAKEIVLSETAEEIDDTKENEIKGQLRMYYIYTKENVYIFNSEDGKYVKKENIIE